MEKNKTSPEQASADQAESADYYFGGLKLISIHFEEGVFAVAQSAMSPLDPGPFGPFTPVAPVGPIGPFGPFGPFGP